MKLDSYVRDVLKIEFYGCSQHLHEYFARFPEVYVYRDGYVVTAKGKLKQPSIYKCVKSRWGDNRLVKFSGSGHEEIIARTYSHEYNVFTSKEEAIKWAEEGELKRWRDQDLYESRVKVKLQQILFTLSKEDSDFLKEHLNVTITLMD